jgi:DNA-binding transcriptional ArsR family regulator
MDVNSNTNPIDFAKALSDPTRQRIMDTVCCCWMNVGEIVAGVGVSQPTVSHHLAILRETGLVHVRQEGKHSFYSLNQQKVVTCCGQIMQVFAPDVVGTVE